jgi:hypothetical protein
MVAEYMRVSMVLVQAMDVVHKHLSSVHIELPPCVPTCGTLAGNALRNESASTR